MKKLIEKLPDKYQWAYAELVSIITIRYSHYIVHFVAFFILNLVVFGIGALFFELTFFKIIGFSVFNGIWMSIAFLKINRYLLKRKKK